MIEPADKNKGPISRFFKFFWVRHVAGSKERASHSETIPLPPIPLPNSWIAKDVGKKLRAKELGAEEWGTGESQKMLWIERQV